LKTDLSIGNLMILQIETTSIPGLKKIIVKSTKDQRGEFVKVFHEDFFKENKIETFFSEEYYSISQKKVLRGIHFQLPPHAHNKLILCPQGSFVDVAVDLRKGSPSYGKFDIFNVTADDHVMLYFPVGIGHAFYSTSDNTIIYYKVSTVYSPSHDSGILWNSLPIPWPDKNPIISDRDKSFIPFDEFDSPFIYNEV
jgi:dTDP-4-dehydrorhamnose 3,5-epimerase